MAKDAQVAAQVTIHTGTVLVAAAFENQYVIRLESGIILATALESGGNRRGGHLGGGTYLPGTAVLVARLVRDEETSVQAALPNILLGAFAPYPTFEGTEFAPVEMVPDVFSDAIHNEAYRKVLENQPLFLINENRGGNRPLDILPGDWFKSTVLGGCLLLSQFMTRIGGSPDSSLTFHGLEQMAELISLNFSQDHGSQFRELLHRGITAIDVSRFAFTLNEALGGESPLESTNDPDNPAALQPKMGNMQTGFFRRELFQEGVEGEWDQFRTDDQRTTHIFGEEIYPGVLSTMSREDGIYRLRATKEIRFEKTYGIVSTWNKQDLRGAPSGTVPAADERVDIQFKQEELGLQTEDEVSALLPILHDKFATLEEEKLFFRGLKTDGDVWFFPTVEEVRQRVFAGEAPTLRRLGDQEQEYTLDDVVSKDIEVYPGRKIRLFKNSSVFLMADDGGVILGDGFGAEIRLHRGAVTIAAAGDLRILPGRDLVEQVPGNRISRVGKRIEFSSTDDAVVVKAHTNMQLCSGGDDGGMTTIENRTVENDLSEITDNQLHQGEAFGSGIQIKAPLAGTSILGSFLYAGAYASGNGSRNGVDASGKPCDILLDSGSGDMLLRGATGLLSFKDQLAMTMMERATGMYLSASQILLLAREEITAITSALVVDKSVGQVMRPVLKAARVDVSRKDNLPASDPILEVNGAIQSKGAIASKSSILSEDSVVSNLGANPDPITDSSQRVRVELITEDLTRAAQHRESISAAASSTKELLERMVVAGVATERGQKITELAFPDSETPAYRAFEYSLVLPKWQRLLTSTDTWLERGVPHAILETTYPYPGRTVYEQGTPLITEVGDEIQRLPMSAYKKNLS